MNEITVEELGKSEKPTIFCKKLAGIFGFLRF